MTTKTIILPGDPTSQQRPRIFAKGAMDPCWKAKQQHKEYILDKFSPIIMATEPINLILRFHYAYPKAFSAAKKATQQKVTRPDLDNLAKYILDMGNKFLWEDDSLIVGMICYKVYSPESKTELAILNTDSDKAVH